MRAWEIFWTVSLLVSAVSFAAITAVVSARGFGDLRDMFSSLRRQGESAAEP